MTLAQRTLLKEWFGAAALVVVSLALALAGCEQQNESEKVFDLEAPGVDIEIEKPANDVRGTVEIETGPPADTDPSADN